MTRKSKPASPQQKEFVLPRLSDEAVIQIQDFLHIALDIFEDHYGNQIERFYQSIWQDSPELDLGESHN
ncbi:MAG: hypothetical protein ACYC4S_16710 [Rhodoferax sp.]